MSNDDPTDIPRDAQRKLAVIGSIFTSRINRVGLIRTEHNEHPGVYQTVVVVVRQDGGMMPVAIIPDDPDIAFSQFHPIQAANANVEPIPFDHLMDDLMDALGVDSPEELAAMGALSIPGDDDDKPSGCGDPDCPGCGDSDLAIERREAFIAQQKDMQEIIAKVHNARNN